MWTIVESELDVSAAAELILLMMVAIIIAVKRREFLDSILPASLFGVVNYNSEAYFSSLYIYLPHEKERRKCFFSCPFKCQCGEFVMLF